MKRSAQLLLFGFMSCLPARAGSGPARAVGTVVAAASAPAAPTSSLPTVARCVAGIPGPEYPRAIEGMVSVPFEVAYARVIGAALYHGRWHLGFESRNGGDSDSENVIVIEAVGEQMLEPLARIPISPDGLFNSLLIGSLSGDEPPWVLLRTADQQSWLAREVGGGSFVSLGRSETQGADLYADGGGLHGAFAVIEDQRRPMSRRVRAAIEADEGIPEENAFVVTRRATVIESRQAHRADPSEALRTDVLYRHVYERHSVRYAEAAEADMMTAGAYPAGPSVATEAVRVAATATRTGVAVWRRRMGGRESPSHDSVDLVVLDARGRVVIRGVAPARSVHDYYRDVVPIELSRSGLTAGTLWITRAIQLSISRLDTESGLVQTHDFTADALPNPRTGLDPTLVVCAEHGWLIRTRDEGGGVVLESRRFDANGDDQQWETRWRSPPLAEGSLGRLDHAACHEGSVVAVVSITSPENRPFFAGRTVGIRLVHW